MVGNGVGVRLPADMRDPWALLLSVFGGGAVWAFGTSIPLAVGTAGVMFVTAALVGVVARSRDDPPARLRPGTRQHESINLLDGHVRSLRALQTGAAGLARTKAEDALAAADAARPSVLQVAAAIDALDEAISAARELSGHGEHVAESIRNTVRRLRSRRTTLFDKLTAAVDEVATVYAGLLELSATERTMGVSLDDTEVGAVNDSVTLLRMTFAELEADAVGLRGEDLV
jgi:hypothetical protein